MFRTSLLATGIIGLLGGSAAMAVESRAVTDLNVRAGPGPNYAVTGVIPAQATVEVNGCLAAVNWCQVSHGAQTGWSYGAYLTTKIGDDVVVLTDNRDMSGVGTVIYQQPAAPSTVILSSPDAIGGELIPVLPGAAVGTVVDPGDTVRSYVIGNPVEPLYLEGEVVPGARIPDAIDLRQVPDSAYSYAYVNGVPVIVEPADRRIVYIVRE